jgi:pimeloyl-ACP methyl ester carboxylesterase
MERTIRSSPSREQKHISVICQKAELNLLDTGHFALEEEGDFIDVKAVTASVQRPIAVQCIQEPAPKPAWRSKPSWFLIAEEDRMINPKTQHFMAERMAAKVRVHPVDHTPLLTAPEVVVDIIREAARETLTC